MPKSQDLQKQPVTLLITREVNPKFGDIRKAMSSLGYEIQTGNIQHEIAVTLEEEEKVTCFTELKGTLLNGELSSIPDFLSEHVAFYEKALRESHISGVFIPPSTKGVMFNCMVTPIQSMFEAIVPPDDKLSYDISPYTDLIKEASIILAARKLKLPVFGSCHGAQLLWYMHGGELYSMPKYTSSEGNPFMMSEGMLLNPGHTDAGVYQPTASTQYEEQDGYESDDEEISANDYNHNLLMVTSKDAFPKFNAKKHPCMLKGRDQFFPQHRLFSTLPRFKPSIWPEQVVVRSFTFPGCIATQWHPHKSLHTKSAIHYLHLFGQQCLAYTPQKDCLTEQDDSSPRINAPHFK
jgi:hypothetical protein